MSNVGFFLRARCQASYKRARPMVEVRVAGLPANTSALIGSLNLLTK
jgi:hypothetical protein